MSCFLRITDVRIFPEITSNRYFQDLVLFSKKSFQPDIAPLLVLPQNDGYTFSISPLSNSLTLVNDPVAPNACGWHLAIINQSPNNPVYLI